MEGIPLILESAGDIVVALVDGIITAVPLLVAAMANLGSNCIIPSISVVIISVAIITAVPLLVAAMPKIIMAIVTGLITGIPKILEAAGKLVVNMFIIPCARPVTSCRAASIKSGILFIRVSATNKTSSTSCGTSSGNAWPIPFYHANRRTGVTDF